MFSHAANRVPFRKIAKNVGPEVHADFMQQFGFRMGGDLPNSYGKPSATKMNSIGDDYAMFERQQQAIYERWFMSTIYNLFEWRGVPETLDMRAVEILARQYSQPVAIGENQNGNIVILGSDEEINFDTFQQPYLNSFAPDFWNGILGQLGDLRNLKPVQRMNPTEGDYVLFTNRNDFSTLLTGVTAMPDVKVVQHYSQLMAANRVSSRSIMLKMKAPYIINAKKGSVQEFNMVGAIRAGKEVISVDPESTIAQDVAIMNLGVPSQYMAQLKDEWNNILSELLNYFGIKSIGVDKRERLVASEAEGNAQFIEAAGNVYLNARRNFCDMMNLRFGINMEVDWAQDSYEKLVRLGQAQQVGAPSLTMSDNFSQP